MPIQSFNNFKKEELADFFANKSVLVTGATGSFGKAFVDYLLEIDGIHRIIIFSRDEYKQFEMEQSLKGHRNFSALRFFLGDIRDESRLRMAFREVDIVVHAAALKQVVAAEYNPFEFIRTNVIGAENIVRAALDNGVQKVVALSTDKAVNPVNLYGTSKLASDKIFVGANNLSGSRDTRFAVVRYGNVVGSRGSIVPFFRSLVEKGATKLPITDARMTRFWITLSQGVDFVISSLMMMNGGEIFVPKIPSMKVTDLAQTLAPGLEHDIIGIRPGEKIHELMITKDDARNTYDLGDRYAIEADLKAWGDTYSYANSKYPRVDKEFEYASNINDEWLDENGLLEFLNAA
jgi:UDP-N-acetylglucosamine 4,6-dehydratase